MQNTSPRSLQQVVQMITPLKSDCDEDLLDVASTDLDQTQFDTMVEEDESQSENNEAIEQEKNHNDLSNQDKQILILKLPKIL